MLISLPSANIFAEDADTKGATLGKWTMDLDSAAKIAKQKKLPILLNFSGSDWCGWCKIMKKNVFDKKDWNTYAKDNILLVFIDFPQDTSLVPKEYVARNEELKTKYEVEGFPSFIILDDDGDTVLGRLSAGQDKTPRSFIQELAQLTRFRTAVMTKYAETLKPDAKAAYLAIVNQITKDNLSIKTLKQEIMTSAQEIEKLQQNIDLQKSNAQELRATQLGPKEIEKYKQIKAEHDKATTALTDWLATKPDGTMRNKQKYQDLSSTIQDLSAKLLEY